MSTGWRWITSDGKEFKSQVSAKNHLRANPALTIVFSELTMAGERRTDVTEQFRASITYLPDEGGAK